MRSIPAALITEKNKPASEHPWAFLLDVQIDASTWIYITNYDAIYEYWSKYHDDWTGDRDKIIFPHSGGSSYEFFPFRLDVMKETSLGGLDKVRVVIDNSNRQMEAYLHSYDLVGNEVILRIVNLNYMTSANNQIIDYFKILSIVSGNITTFSLGHVGLISKNFGRRITRSCTFRFKDNYCGYAGAGTTCKRILGDESTPDTCKYYGNSARYGGFPNAKGFIK
jgi:phage-related protein